MKFEEMLIVNGCNTYYCCLYSFIVDFHHLKVKLTKETMHATQCEAYVWCRKLKYSKLNMLICIVDVMHATQCEDYKQCLITFQIN